MALTMQLAPSALSWHAYKELYANGPGINHKKIIYGSWLWAINIIENQYQDAPRANQDIFYPI